MGFLSQYSATERVDLGDDFYAVVRVFLPSEAEFAAQQRLAKLGVVNDGNGGVSVHTDFDQGAYQYEVAAQALVEWNLSDTEDKVLPFATLEEKRASLKLLPKVVIDQIVAKVKEKPDKDPDFRAADSSGDKEG